MARLLARLSGLPAVVLLLGVGLLIGRAGLDLVQPESLGRGLEPVVALLVSPRANNAAGMTTAKAP